MVTRWWVFRGVHAWFSFLHPWSPSPGGGLGGSGFWPFSQPLLLGHLFSLLYWPVFAVLRPRVGSNFPKLILVPSAHLKVVGGGCKSQRMQLCQVQSIEWQPGQPSPDILDFLSNLVLYPFCPSLRWDFRFCRGPNCPWMYPKDFLCFILSGLDYSPPRLGPLDSPWADGPGP